MADARELAGRHAVVTGGTRGIGRAVAETLMGLGATVTVVSRSGGSIQGAHSIAADVTTVDGAASAFEGAASANGPVAILINNVGGAESAPFMRTDMAMWQRMYNLNVQSTWLCTQQVLPGMLDRAAGTVVNVASEAGVRGYPYVSAYVAAKHAVVGLTRALAAEVDDSGVTVNAVCPGFVKTDMTVASAAAVAKKTSRTVEDVLAQYAATNAGGRLLEPSEVADRIVWFCLPDNAMENGVIMEVEEET